MARVEFAGAKPCTDDAAQPDAGMHPHPRVLLSKAPDDVGDLIDLRFVITPEAYGAGELTQPQSGYGVVVCRKECVRHGSVTHDPSRLAQSTCHHEPRARCPSRSSSLFIFQLTAD